MRTPESLEQLAGRTVGPFRRLGTRTVWSLETGLAAFDVRGLEPLEYVEVDFR